MNRKHALLMVLCCLTPLAGFAAISIFRIPANTVIYTGLVLLCPAMHLLMMRGMMSHGHDGEYAHHQSKTAQTIDNARESAVTGK
jgi:hypothetical protein